MKCLSLYNQYAIKDNKTYVYNMRYIITLFEVAFGTIVAYLISLCQ